MKTSETTSAIAPKQSLASMMYLASVIFYERGNLEMSQKCEEKSNELDNL